MLQICSSRKRHILHNLQTALLLAALALLIAVGVLFSCWRLSDRQAGELSSQVLRFHVLADSDSAEDQQIKLKLRSYLLDRIAPCLSSCADVSEAKTWVRAHLPFIESAANDYMHSQGLDDPVRAVYTNCAFPIRTYGDYTFPPGNYDTLQIRIGQAAGHNWWCVLYPSLCFTGETTACFPESSRASLEEGLSPENRETIRGPVSFRWKAAEFFQSLIGR